MKSFVYYYSPAPPETKEHREQGLKNVREKELNAREWHRKMREAELAHTAKRRRKAGALAYAATEARHAVQGPAPTSVIEQRIAICRACPGRVDVFHGATDDGGVGFCTKCGCPASQRSKLSVKLTLAGAACPIGKFGAVEGTGGSLKTAVQAVKGMAQTLGAIVKRAVTRDGTEDAKP
jgi:hypothetical protein